MAEFVCEGASLMCSFGTTPATLSVTSQSKVKIQGKLVATVMDKQIANIPTFGMCSTQSNPAVASATAAALGTPTPAPCVPVIPAPSWAPTKPNTLISEIPVLTKDSVCLCAYGGEISITSPGQVKVESSG